MIQCRQYRFIAGIVQVGFPDSDEIRLQTSETHPVVHGWLKTPESFIFNVGNSVTNCYQPSI